MAHTERYLSAAFDRSAFETARRLRVHPGKTHTQNGGSARSAGNASIISWCSANAICAICCCPTWTTTILFHNTHPTMRLKRRGFADLDAIPWGDLGSASRDERRAEPPARRALIGGRSTDHPAEDDPLRSRPLRRRA